MTVIIRPMSLDDREVVFRLVEAFATSYAPERAAFEESTGGLLGDDRAWLSVAEQDGMVVGYCLGFVHLTFYANGPVGWVEEIMVAEAARGQGIGRALMDGFEAWAAQRGAKLIALATRRAALFYRALGYTESAAYFRKKLGD